MSDVTPSGPPEPAPIYAGFNFSGLNEDDYNGGGVNDPVDVTYFVAASVALVDAWQPSVALDIDIYVNAERQELAIARERRTVNIRG